MWKYVVLLAIFTSAYKSPDGLKYLNFFSPDISTEIPADDIEDVFLNTTQLIEKYGYPTETHELKTDDGYFITVHRIPYGKSNTNAHKIPVLLMHGLMSSSVDWIINGPGKSLGYILADAGYDVWMGNARGNYYSRKHITMNPDTEHKFWDFSWDEIGYFDLPAMITHILNTTGKSKLHYVGHSQGGADFFAMASERPEFNDKILLMQGLAPAVFMSHCENLVLKYLSPFAFTWGKVRDFLGIKEFSPHLKLTNYMSNTFCSKNSDFLSVCDNFLFVLCGFDSRQLNSTMVPVYLSHSPSSISCKQITHYTQSYVSGKFSKLDRGSEENIRIYGSITPPEYDLTKVTAPVVVYYGESDSFVDSTDVKILHEKFANPRGLYKISIKEFNHLDFLWAMNAPYLVYEPMLKLMNEYNIFLNEVS